MQSVGSKLGLELGCGVLGCGVLEEENSKYPK